MCQKKKKCTENYTYDDVRTATLEDVKPLTEMLMSDDEFSASYTYDEMFGQISERISDGYGKTLYIRNENEICAQLGISANMEKFMVISNVYTAKQHRGKSMHPNFYNMLIIFLGAKGYICFVMATRSVDIMTRQDLKRFRAGESSI